MKPTRGFTLIELMVTLAVAAILLTVAVPNFQRFIKCNALSARTNGLVADLQLARSEAAKRGANVSICPNNNNACGSSTATNWTTMGWIIIPVGGTAAIRSGDKLSGTLGITSAPSQTLTFKSSGTIEGTQKQTITLTDSQLNKTKIIEISPTGHISTGGDKYCY